MAVIVLLTKFWGGKELLAGHKERGVRGMREMEKDKKENRALTVPGS